MRINVHANFAILIVVLLLSSCTAYKKIPYVKDADTLDTQSLANAASNYEAKVMPNDILLITVNTPTPEASKDFNLPLIPQTGNSVLPTNVTSTSEDQGTLQNYIVDNQGYIDFPILGKLKVGGLTKPQAELLIHNSIYPAYTKENPIVTLRFLNYKVSVLGEVNRPGTYTSVLPKMTIFEALASAGDMTIYGKRDAVKLIRTDENGQKEIFVVNMQDKNLLLNNNLYNLQQNDVLYVEPNKSKGNNSQFGTFESMTLTGVSLLISIISIVTR